MRIFVGDALTTDCFALFALLWLPHGLRPVEGRAAATRTIWQSWREALADVAANRRFLHYLGGLLCLAAAFVQVFDVLAVEAVDRGLSPGRLWRGHGFQRIFLNQVPRAAAESVGATIPAPSRALVRIPDFCDRGR